MNNWRGYLLSLLTGLAVGLYLADGQLGSQSEEKKETTDQEKEVVKEVSEIIKWKERVVVTEKIVRPDGTIEERTTESEKAALEEYARRDREIERLRKELERTEQKVHPSRSNNYSVALQWQPDLSLVDPSSLRPGWQDVNWVVGRKLLLDLWLEGGYRPRGNQITLGLRYEW